MNLKIFKRWLAVMALSLTATGICMAETIADYPYTPPFTSNAGWTTYKGGNGNWSINSAGYWQNSVSSGMSNSWLFSPALVLKGGYKYTFSYTIEVGSTSYAVEVNQSFLLNSANSTAEKIFEGPKTTTSKTELSITSTFEYSCINDETVYFALFNTTDGANGWKTNFKNFSIEEEADAKKPLAISSLEVIPSEDGSRSATISWINPSAYNTGDALEINNIKLQRDGEMIATLTQPAQIAAGASVSYVDNFPTSGKKTYTITVEDSEGLQSVKEITTPYLGPVEPFQTPYEENFANAETYDFWTIKNVPAEGEEEYIGNYWSIIGGSSGMPCTLNGSVTNNSWAYTPPVELKAGKAYQLTFVHKIDNKAQLFPYKVTIGKSTDPEEESEELLGDPEYISGLAYTNITFTKDFSVAEDGIYHIGINSYGKLSSSYYTNKMTVTKIGIEEVPIVPQSVTDFSLVSGSENAIEATLSFKMPEESVTGLALSEVNAEIIRDGEITATLECTAGQEVTYTDNAEKGLTNGFHTYKIVAVYGDGRSEASEILSTDFLGGAVELPFTSDFENASALWTVLDNSTRGNKKFEFNNGHAILDEGSGNKTALDDWLITPMLKMHAGKSYEVTIEAKAVTTSTYSGVRITPDLHLGTSNTVESMETEKKQLSFNNTQSEIVKAVITPAEGSEHTLGLHVTSPSANAWGIDVYSIHVEELATRPATITDAKACAAAESNEVTISWTMPVKSDYNADLTEDMMMTANIKRQGSEESLVLLEALTPGQTVTWTDTNAENGINTYEIYTSVVSAGDIIGGTSDATIVKSDYVGAAKNLPYIADFANSNSEWTQLSESGNYQYQFDVEGHEGHAYLLAGANEDVSASYKNWLITPALNLKSGKAYNLNFTARSKPKNSGYAIDYAVYVAKEPTIEGMKAGKKITPVSNPKVTESELTARSIDFEVAEDGKYFIGYFVDAGTDSAVSEVGEWTVSQSMVTPKPAPNATASINEDGYVAVSFTAPLQNILDGSLPDLLEARLYRDKEETPCEVVEVAPGAHGDIIATDFDSKYHSYELRIGIADEGESTAKQLGTFFVGQPAEVPYTADFANNPGEWNISDISSGKILTEMSEDGLQISSESTSENIRVYAYSPLLNLDADQIYRLKAKVNSTDKNVTVKVSINPDGGTPQILANNIKMATGDNELKYDFKPNVAGKSTFSIYVERGYYNSDVVTLSDITLTTAASTPAKPTSLSAVDNEEELNVTFEFTMPTKGMLGENLAEDAELTANVYVNGEESTTITGKAPGETVSVTLEMPGNGIHTLGVSATLGNETSETATIRTEWIGGGLKIGEGEYYSPELTEEGLDGYTTHKSDSYAGWHINSSGLEATGTGEYWLITTPFELNPDHQYKISFTHRLKSGNTGSLQAFLGEGQHKDFMVTPISEEVASSSSRLTHEQVFDINGMVTESEDNPIDNPEESRRKEPAESATKHYIALKASNLTGSMWTTPAIGIEEFKISHHKTISTGIEMIRIEGTMLTSDGITLDQPGDIRIFATDGRLEVAALNVTELSTASLQPGVHIVTITSGGKTMTLKFNK